MHRHFLDHNKGVIYAVVVNVGNTRGEYTLARKTLNYTVLISIIDSLCFN